MRSEYEFSQCNCDVKIQHNGHCWYCNAPIIYSKARRIYITKEGHIAGCCQRKECQKIAEGAAEIMGYQNNMMTMLKGNGNES